ncbi:MAG: lysophospholipid acyltransferase family protein [Bryobacteraceae bacterium]
MQYLIARFVLWTLRHTPPGFARFYTFLLDRAIPRLRRVGMQNLELAYPEMPEHERSQIIDGVFASIARLLAVFARFPGINRQNVSEWIRYEGLEHFQEAKKRGKGVLFATAHMGNWELSAFAHAMMTEPMNIVVRPLDNPAIDSVIEQHRQLSGNRIIGKRDAARLIFRALHNNEAVGVLIDQNTSLAEGVFIDFFGRPACTGVAFAKIAAHTGATVIPGFAIWSAAEEKYVLHFYPPVEITGDAHADTQRIHAALEQVIREYPDQWLWIHRRWKTRPEGEPPIYNKT